MHFLTGLITSFEAILEPANLLIPLGIVFLVSLFADWIGRHTALPRVALLLVAGFLLGPEAVGVIPEAARDWFAPLANIALVMVGFLVGGTLTRDVLRERGRAVLVSSALITVCTFAVVFAGMLLAGLSAIACLVLAAVATATDPAATQDTIRSSGSRGPFSSTLTGIVAVDDAWGLVAFSIALAAADLILGHSGFEEALIHGARDLLGGLALGALVGVPMALVSGRIHRGEPTQSEALGMVFLCGGLALWLEVSFLLAAMTMGLVVANVATHHRRPFHAVEGIEWPFLVMFFMLAGATLEPSQIASAGWLLAGYFALRLAGRIAGGALGGRVAGLPALQRRWLGIALLPQAGVALGMAMVGVERFPAVADTVLPVVVAGTILFEVVGPVLTRMSLVRVGETRARR